MNSNEPGLATLTQERRHERGLRIGRRLLLVLAVVAGRELASEAPEDERRDRERGQHAEPQEDQGRPPRVADRVVDPLLVALVGLGVRQLLGCDLLEPVAAHDTHAGRRRERAARIQGPELHELVRRDVQGAQVGARPVDRDVAAHPDGVPPGPDDVARTGRRRGQPTQRLVPLVAPDLEIDVDDVVVGDRQAAHPIADLEGPDLVRRAVVPHDPLGVAVAGDAERPRRARAPQLDASTGRERAAVLERR